jgi:DNA-binding MarR family transcriptional regulator
MSTQSNDREFARAAALAADLRAVMGKLKRRLREQARLGDLTESQISTLSRLEREGSATVTALAQAEGMRPQSMGAIVAALEAAGLVAGAPDPNDGRQTLLSLPDAGRDRIAAGRAARQDWLLRAIQNNLAPAEQDRLASAVKLLARLVDT